jgi:hypothetical protein
MRVEDAVMRSIGLVAVMIVMSAIPVAAQSLGATASAPAATAESAVVPRCEEIPDVSPPADAFRDAPIYVANEQPIGRLRGWARQQPGFETLWIDRDHLGWVVLAFSVDAEARQADLERRFPGVGAVAVGVDWTYRGLRRLQRRVVRDLEGPLAVGVDVSKGVVTVSPGVLYPERVATIGRLFGGERICIEGTDPSDAPKPGPQPQSGEGWHLLGDRKVGPPYRTGIATDEATWSELWNAAGMDGIPPSVDFQRDVAIWFGAVYGISCPDIRLDDVVVDAERQIVHALIVLPDPPPACTDDARGHAYLVALERARLPGPPLTIQLDADGPPPGAPEERTVVEADLRIPGLVAAPDEIHGAPPPDTRYVLRSGMVTEPGFPFPYLMDTRCGVEWLGELNDVWWRTETPPGQPAYVPREWQEAIDASGTLELEIILRLDDDPLLPDGDPTIEATLNGLTLTYRPSPTTPDDCA